MEVMLPQAKGQQGCQQHLSWKAQGQTFPGSLGGGGGSAALLTP